MSRRLEVLNSNTPSYFSDGEVLLPTTLWLYSLYILLGDTPSCSLTTNLFIGLIGLVNRLVTYNLVSI